MSFFPWAPLVLVEAGLGRDTQPNVQTVASGWERVGTWVLREASLCPSHRAQGAVLGSQPQGR